MGQRLPQTITLPLLEMTFKQAGGTAANLMIGHAPFEFEQLMKLAELGAILLMNYHFATITKLNEWEAQRDATTTTHQS